MDLSLIPMKEIIAEIERRTEYYVFAYTRTQEGNENLVNSFWSGKNWVREVGIANILANDVTVDFSKDDEMDGDY